MSSQEPPLLNQTYQNYKDNPTSENYEAFGIALMHFVKATIMKSYGSRFRELEDVAGDACLSVLQDLSIFNPQKSSFSTWATNVTLHTCVDALRKRDGLVDIELPEDAIRDRSYDFYATIDAKLDLEKKIAKLPKDEQELIDLKIHGFSNEEIAAELNTTKGYIEVKWNRICRKIRTLGGGS